MRGSPYALGEKGRPRVFDRPVSGEPQPAVSGSVPIPFIPPPQRRDGAALTAINQNNKKSGLGLLFQKDLSEFFLTVLFRERKDK